MTTGRSRNEPPSARKSIADLLAVMAALRTPGTGCPWDLEQTFQDHCALHHRGSLRGRRRHRQRATWPRSRTSWAICCFRLSITRAWPRRTARSPSPMWSDAITAEDDPPPPARLRQRGRARRRRRAGFWERIKAEERSAKQRQPDSPPPHAEGVSSTRRGEGLGVRGNHQPQMSGAPPP